MSALATISNKEELIQKVCVARDEQVGVYGFVFHRGKVASVTQLIRTHADVTQTGNGYQKLLTISCT